MKDLDFDELDRAVNSLMEGVSRSTPEPPKSQEKVVTITPSADNGASFGQQTASPQTPPASPSNPSPTSVTTPVADPASRPSTPVRERSSQLPARRNGGRFMDVVHPSSNMKTQTPPRPVSRQGVSIATDNNESNPSGSHGPSPASPSQPAPAQSEAPITQSANDWPDPIDVSTFSEEPSTVSDQTPDRDRDTIAEAAKSLSNESTTSDSTSSYEPAPLQTPFLADPKVEKRPLGGFAHNLHDTTANDTTPLTTPSTIDPEELTAELQADKQTVPDPEPIVPAELPDELGHDVMAIEADTSNAASSSAQTTEIASTAGGRPQLQVQNQVTPGASVMSEAASTGPSSIAQQYRQEPSTNESAHGGIYDTDSYHQPLAHPEHKKSGWLVVIWVALLLLLGGGGAAALYYLGII